MSEIRVERLQYLTAVSLVLIAGAAIPTYFQTKDGLLTAICVISFLMPFLVFCFNKSIGSLYLLLMAGYATMFGVGLFWSTFHELPRGKGHMWGGGPPMEAAVSRFFVGSFIGAIFYTLPVAAAWHVIFKVFPKLDAIIIRRWDDEPRPDAPVPPPARRVDSASPGQRPGELDA